jgi:hypothetical protein
MIGPNQFFRLCVLASWLVSRVARFTLIPFPLREIQGLGVPVVVKSPVPWRRR